MSDIIVAQTADTWTVRHVSLLYERFEDKMSAVRDAQKAARDLLRRGETVEIRLATYRRRP